MHALERALRKEASPEKARILQRFFRTGPGQYGEGDVFLGVMVPETRAIAKRFPDLPLPALAALLQSPLHEVRLAALLVLGDQFSRAPERKRGQLTRFYLQHRARVNNWDLVDLSAPAILGRWLVEHPQQQDTLDRLACSPRLWDRRIAIVATLALIRAGRHEPTLRLCRLLLRDRQDLVHKACGWMLREVGKRDLQALRGFLDQEAGRMPRTMLRYAIERLPEQERRRHLRQGAARD
ncbi:MAG: DNA alkylation repair protein [Candidatus Aenigmarchaeota archaeon]|nr:DNA alkylation repair protein [Candidatus Aenigmarchaeota archaeon]